MEDDHIWRNDDGKFYFLDESDGTNGPYDSYDEASKALTEYCWRCLGVYPSRKRRKYETTIEG